MGAAVRLSVSLGDGLRGCAVSWFPLGFFPGWLGGVVMPSDSQIEDGLRPILRQIVGRCHVADSLDSVIEYAKSRLAPGAWESMPSKHQLIFQIVCRKLHEQNRDLYRHVMGGTVGR